MSDLRNVISPPHEIRRTLAPGEIWPHDCGESVFFRMIEATGKLRVAFESGSPVTAELGLAYQCPLGKYFRRLTFENATAVPVTFYAITGELYIIDDRLNVLTASDYLPVSEPPTKLIGKDVSQINAGANVELSGVPGAGQYRRAAVLIDNLDAAAALTLFDDTGKLAGYVPPGASRYLPLSGYLKIANETGAAISCGIGELWQMNPS